MSDYKKNTPVETLIPYARNARTHSDAQVAQIAASIREFGFCNPVLIDKQGGIIAGHGRVLAAQKLGLKQIPTITLGHLNETQKRAYILADNKLAMNAGWDEEMLKVEIEALKDDGFDLALAGFDDVELNSIINGNTDGALSDNYTHKVDAPVYEPKGDQPPLADLLDTSKSDDFFSKIEASDIPHDIKTFLKKAASRHIVFRYDKIAEYYCHANKETQELMEDMALVIIDFKKAMQLGYVKLKEEIADALEAEGSDSDDE